jgi:pimeloyl-ACP methyl ester carboxylesterase
MKTFLALLLLFGLFLTACDDSYSEFDNEYADSYDEPFSDEASKPIAADVEETAVPPITNSGQFTSETCPFNIPDGYDIECGILTVPENRTTANTADIQLAVAIIHAADGAQDTPIIYLAGGPGGSAIDDFVADPSSWDYSFIQSRDLILLDQRGTGYSQPSLDCPEFADAADDENPDELCFDRLIDDGIDLAAYNTRENAADVAALRQALDIAEWDLLGISYGTRLALDVMRYHPQGVRAVILDSPFPPNADMPVDEIYSVTDALSELFADCARDAYCSEEYPDLETVFLETVDRLNADETADIYGDDLVFALSSAFSDTSLIPLLPYVIYEVANDNYAALDEIAEDAGYGRPRYQSGEDRSDSEGMFNSVICHDEMALGDYDRVETAVVGNIPVELEGALLQNTYDVTQLCAYWNPRDQVDNTAVSSSIPTLILAGQYDVATPPRWARLTAQTLSSAYLFEFPGAGHSLLSGVDCAIAMTNDFLENPEQEPDSRCIDEIEWPYFE